MKNSGLLLLLVTLIAGCFSDTKTSSAGFVTLLGNDTLAVEQFEKNDHSITARVILRSPETSFTSYKLEMDSLGGISEMVRRSHSLGERFNGRGEVVQVIRSENDSLVIETATDDGFETEKVEYQEGILPFIDMVHWPFELAFNKAVETSRDSINQPLLSRGGVSNFIIAKIRNDSLTLRHPFRGVMGVNVNMNGDLVHLDAGLTTRKLKVNRTYGLDLEAIGSRYAEMEKNGRSFGELSGAESAEFSFHNADFRVQYGSPEKRGRDIFGGIVPWGERWRTGANRATHFRTSRDLVIGDLRVPAGEYTLFTIPESDGGTLMINRQTGQNGQSYDESRDLGRVPMELSTKEDITEKFTITLEEKENNNGVLKLIWDQTVFSVDFEVQ